MKKPDINDEKYKMDDPYVIEEPYTKDLNAYCDELENRIGELEGQNEPCHGPQPMDCIDISYTINGKEGTAQFIGDYAFYDDGKGMIVVMNKDSYEEEAFIKRDIVNYIAKTKILSEGKLK